MKNNITVYIVLTSLVGLLWEVGGPGRADMVGATGLDLPRPGGSGPGSSRAVANTKAVPIETAVSRIPASFRGRIIRRRLVRLPEKIIALTFDDGPDPYITPQILRILARYKARATFFVMGQWAQEWPDLVRQEAEQGHAVGSHSYSHPEEVNEAHSALELQKTARIIEQATGLKPVLFRPPYGHTYSTMSRVAIKEGYVVVRWTIGAADSVDLQPADIVARVTRTPVAGDIVLLHDGRDRDNTMKALPEILRRLQAAGFKFVTVPQLLWEWERYGKAKMRPAGQIRQTGRSRRGSA